MLTVMAPTASSISASISGTQESGTQQTISMISNPTIHSVCGRQGSEPPTSLLCDDSL